MARGEPTIEKTFLRPLALLLSLVLLYPAWHRHDVKELSPEFSTPAAAWAWAKKEEADRKCIAASVDTEFRDAAADGLDFTGQHPYSILLRCNQRKVVWRLLFVMVGPWLFFLTLIFIANRSSGEGRVRRKF